MEDTTRSGEFRLHKNEDVSENLPSSNSESLGLSGADVESLSPNTPKDKLENR